MKSAEEAVASLKSAGVDTIISNGVDKKLRNLLSVSGIEIIPILRSPVEDVIANFLDGKYNKA